MTIMNEDMKNVKMGALSITARTNHREILIALDPLECEEEKKKASKASKPPKPPKSPRHHQTNRKRKLSYSVPPEGSTQVDVSSL